MNVVFFYSLILKGIGAVLEILVQIAVTSYLGVEGYGTYSTWVSGADVFFWVCFSGITKCNTFYLSDKSSTIHGFKRKYYSWYVFPAMAAVAAVLMTISGNMFCGVIVFITGLELLTMDRASDMLACGEAVTSLFGEYIVGRAVLLLGAFLLHACGQINLKTLVLLYAVQYGCILIFFVCRTKKKQVYSEKTEQAVSLKKWGAYQRADIVQSMISHMPVVLQYFFSGAFEAGVVSVVLLVKKLINFISGPTAKVFLPEFSRLYRTGNKEQLCICFASIMRMQMLFIGPVAVILIGFPQMALNVFAEELLEYSALFVVCAIVFLGAASLGPCGGLMQMTENERKDNLMRETSLGIMVLSMILLSKNKMFVLYALCVQTIVEAGGKFVFICRWFGKMPGGIKEYMLHWLPTILIVAVVYLAHVQQSFITMVCFAALVGVFQLGLELRSKDSLFHRLLKDGKKNME